MGVKRSVYLVEIREKCLQSPNCDCRVQVFKVYACASNLVCKK